MKSALFLVLLIKCVVYDANVGKFVPQDLATYVENTPSFENKIREVAGTAELVVADGSAVIAKVNVYDDSTYLPLVGNNPGDQAFATDTDILYIWDGSAWQQAGASNSDDLTEGTTNLFYTDARVDARIPTLSPIATDYAISATAPTTPDNEDHWYDTATRSLKVRDTTSTSWIPVVASNNSTIDYALTVEDGYNTALAGPLNIGTNGSINIKGNLNII